MMKKLLLITLAISFMKMNSYGQQIIESSQYMNNDYAYNSAVAGTKANLRVSSGYRKQWLGFEGSPSVQNITFQGRVAKSIGLGAQLYNDTWGLSRRTGLNLGVNYILSISSEIDLSLGVAAIINQFSIDRNKVVTELPEDAAVYDGIQNQLFPDAGFSAYLNSKDFYVGLSILNLVEIQNDLINNTTSQTNLTRTAYFTAGGNYEIAENIVLEPSAIFGYALNATFQYQADVRGVYNNLFWLGVGYRDNQDLIANAGVYVKSFTIGYSFDFHIGELIKNVGTSHEIFVAFDIIKNDRKSSWFKRNRIYNQNRR